VRENSLQSTRAAASSKPKKAAKKPTRGV
jgi:hypothetical protein